MLGFDREISLKGFSLFFFSSFEAFAMNFPRARFTFNRGSSCKNRVFNWRGEVNCIIEFFQSLYVSIVLIYTILEIDENDI